MLIDPQRIGAFAMGLALLLWLGSAYAGYQLDDLFISLAYAHEWAETGSLAWTTGERVEGYSNFGLIAVSALAITMGLPAAVVARVLAVGGAATLLGLAAAWSPADRRGWITVGALAAWAPLTYWSAVALETTVFAALLAAGWALVVRARTHDASWGPGMALLVASAFFRPEGAAYLLLGLGLRTRHEARWRRDDLWAFASLVAFAVYQLWRVAHFGALWPTPFLVKVVDVHTYGVGLQQWSGDLLAAGGLLFVIAAWYRPERRDLVWVLVPALVQSALLIRANGDWMGMSRLVLPGFAASAMAAIAVAQPTDWRRGHVLLLPAVLFFSIWESHWPVGKATRAREPAPLAVPWTGYAKPWMTPFRADLEWAVGHLPDGSRVQIADVGMLGQIDGVAVLDSVGLVDRTSAEHRAYGRHEAEFRARFVAGPDQLDCVRFTAYRGGRPAVDPSVERAFPHRYEVQDFNLTSIWRCRSELVPPSPERRMERWERLHERYPMQIHVTRQLALSRVASGQPLGELAGIEIGGQPIDVLIAFPEPRWPRQDRGFPMYAAGELKSRPMTAQEARGARLRIDVDDAIPDGVPTHVRWEPSCGGPTLDRDFLVPELVDLPDPACDGIVRLVVVLEPHSDGPGRDRNLWVDLVR